MELGSRAIRGVRMGGWPTPRVRVTEVSWDPEAPDDGILALRELGSVRRIAVAIDWPLVFVKRVPLPAVPPAERRNILLLEPERFFAVRSEAVIPAVHNDDVIFAARAAPLARWIAALERIAPVELVETTPVTLGRALARAAIGDALVVCDREAEGTGVVELADGRVTRARRLFRDLAGSTSVPATGAETGRPAYLSPWNDERHALLSERFGPLRPLPPVAGVPERFLAAFGAALGIDAAPHFARTLVAPELEHRIHTRRRRELGLAALATAAALLVALTSLDARRERATRALDAALSGLRQRAAPALQVQTELDRLARRADAIRQIDSERPDPLRVLETLSRHLPARAFVRGIHGAGADWQVDGYAPNAAAVLSALGAAPEFHDVHFLSAMNRAQFGTELYESFALAFRFLPAP